MTARFESIEDAVRCEPGGVFLLRIIHSMQRGYVGLAGERIISRGVLAPGG